MRITDSMRRDTILSDLETASQRLSQTQEQLASGYRINKPSDDPYATGQAISLQSDLAATKQYQSNVAEGNAWLSVTDTSLSQINNALQRARELAVQGASDSGGAVARQAAAQEINQLIDTVKQSADAAYEGRYVLGGTATGSPPYAVGGSDAYGGDSGTVAREIGPGVSVQVNVLGSSLLGSGGGDGKLLDVLRGILQHLTSGTTADANALRTTDLKGLDASLNTLTGLQATVGATTNRLDSATSRLSDTAISTTKLLANVEDADMAQTMTTYTTQQAALQAALQAGANILQSSLMNFLH